MTQLEVLYQCLRHFASMDEANAAMHCADVRYSPITLRLAEALHDLGDSRDLSMHVWAHVGAYEEDKGR